MYILVVVLEAGIYISHIVWRIRYRKLREEAKETGKSIDDLLALRGDTQDTGDLEKGVVPASPRDVGDQRQKQGSSMPDIERDPIEKI
jgi:hypothetical protein